MLKTITNITGQYPATIFAGVVGLVFQFAFLAFYAVSITGWVVNAQGNPKQGGTGFVYFYLVRNPSALILRFSVSTGLHKYL